MAAPQRRWQGQMPTGRLLPRLGWENVGEIRNQALTGND